MSAVEYTARKLGHLSSLCRHRDFRRDVATSERKWRACAATTSRCTRWCRSCRRHRCCFGGFAVVSMGTRLLVHVCSLQPLSVFVCVVCCVLCVVCCGVLCACACVYLLVCIPCWPTQASRAPGSGETGTSLTHRAVPSRSSTPGAPTPISSVAPAGSGPDGLGGTDWAARTRVAQLQRDVTAAHAELDRTREALSASQRQVEELQHQLTDARWRSVGGAAFTTAGFGLSRRDDSGDYRDYKQDALSSSVSVFGDAGSGRTVSPMLPRRPPASPGMASSFDRSAATERMRTAVLGGGSSGSGSGSGSGGSGSGNSPGGVGASPSRDGTGSNSLPMIQAALRLREKGAHLALS